MPEYVRMKGGDWFDIVRASSIYLTEEEKELKNKETKC